MIAGKYVLHLYCDHPSHTKLDGHHPDEFTGENEREALREARQGGWKVYMRPPKTLCPKHNLEARSRLRVPAPEPGRGFTVIVSRKTETGMDDDNRFFSAIDKAWILAAFSAGAGFLAVLAWALISAWRAANG